MSGKNESDPPDNGTEADPPADPDDRTRIFVTEGPPPALPVPHTAGIAPTTGGLATRITVGTLINNNYEVCEVLKSGGMGAVYRGIELGTGDPVAIKAILPELAEDEKAGLLFKREARTLRQLSDEAIVRYYNYVHDSALDRYFLIMEFVEGLPLSEYMKTHGPLPTIAARTLMRRLAKGLAKAHAQDVVHRDLSPDNVMLPKGAVDQARLIDFGIAKSNMVKEGTMAGQFAGKFKYVAPEQLGHFGGVIGPATDVYGLALLISAATLGRPLDMGASIVEAVTSRQTIPDLSEVPQELRPILSFMLEPDPVDRPTSMDAVRRLLEHPEMIPAHYLNGLPRPPAMDATARGTLPTVAATQTFSSPGLQVPMAGGTGFPQTLAPKTVVPLVEPLPVDRSGARMLAGLGLVFALMLAGAGWYAWREGLTGIVRGDIAQNRPAAQAIAPPLANTREGFLAGFDTGPCTYASRVASGPGAGMIVGYSATGDGFGGLPTAYEEAFGARPAILPREVAAAQCPTLDFARALQGRADAAVEMQLSQDQISSGEAMRVDVTAPAGQAIWAVLISPLGAVYNLTSRLSEPVGGHRTMSFGLNLTDGAEAAPQLLLVVSSDAPLARAAAAMDGAQAAELLPIVLAEIEKRGAGSSAALGYVMLTPAVAAPEVPVQEPAPD